mmetsp:Transcript_14462/g.29750  ORF Transcript_14462/g.29750 Transcript_14462/m.29750 type:complete len:82 (+) Transcript_14462:79-324(+)
MTRMGLPHDKRRGRWWRYERHGRRRQRQEGKMSRWELAKTTRESDSEAEARRDGRISVEVMTVTRERKERQEGRFAVSDGS